MLNPYPHNLAARVYVGAGRPVFSEGDEADFAFVVESGEIEISVALDEDHVLLNRLGPGSLLGELSIIDGKPRSATATAVTDTVLTRVSREQLDTRIHSADPVLRSLVSAISAHLRAEATAESRAARGRWAGPGAYAMGSHSAACCPEAREIIQLENELTAALENDELRLHYQPVVRLADSAVVGFEALLRWHSPSRGSVAPLHFIPAVESSPLILGIGNWVARRAISDLGSLQRVAGVDCYVSINIAERQARDPGLNPSLLELLAGVQLPPDRLRLEVLERTLFAGEQILDWAGRCREQGIALILDDFGTGYSNLATLRRLRVDGLKIDRSFIAELDTEPGIEQLCRSVVDLAAVLGVEVVAEGVETEAQWRALARMGCGYAQGYLLARPVPLPELARTLAASPLSLNCG